MTVDEAVFRSAQMSLVQFYVSNEVARDIVLALGELGSVQFIDLNAKVPTFQRAFVSETRRLDTSLRQIDYLREQLELSHIAVPPAWDGEGDSVESVSDVAVRLGELETQIREQATSRNNFLGRQADLLEQRHVLQTANRFFGDSDSVPGQVNVVAGIVNRTQVSALERILWRALRGNLVISNGAISEPLYDPKAKAYVDKNTFIVVTHGKELSTKAAKIAEALDAHVVPVSADSQTRSSQLKELNTQLDDVRAVVNTTEEALSAELETVAPYISAWYERIAKEKAVYETLNLFSTDRNGKLLIGEGWAPTDTIPQLQLTMRRRSEAANIESPSILNVLETTKTPPTYHQTNKVTGAFQAMIDIYAVSSYQEVNPALPTIVTFPFLFAVMFGDLGHGFILALAALYLVVNERKLAKLNYGDIFDMAYSGRYLLLFMGCFSMFTGLLYNDVFSLSMSLFKSGWAWPEHKAGDSIEAVRVGTYALGLDPAWHGAENNLLFTNSYKMKLSILLGWVHMSYSYSFSLLNALYFHIPIDIWGNFVPGLLFFQGIFGYLSLTIVYKWCVDWVKEGVTPPSLLNMLINMFLAPGKIDEPLYKGQQTVQVVLLIVALIAVPWLLLVKPLYLKRQMDRAHHYDPVSDAEEGGDSQSTSPENGDDNDDEEEDDGEPHSFGDILIHQIIHTIEFCLNCVSHTASYLRLWALSLAHAQLSQVLWSMTISAAFGMTGVVGVIMTVVMFAMWFSLTVAVLVLMEGTSAMLHALRLHWVESMSKYYIGEGKPFLPFTFNSRDSSAL